MCTLRNFPNQIEHCIEWARDKFNELFVDTPSDLVSYIDNPKVFVGQLKMNSTSSAIVSTLERIVDFIELKKSNSFDTCVLLAKNQFNTFFNHSIQDLLSIFPKDHLDKSGQPFWSGPKRAPSSFEFDVNNELHLSFVLTYANLIAAALGIKENRDPASIKKIASAAKAKEYIPKKIVVKTPEEEKNQGNNNQPEPVAPEDEETA